MTKRRKIGFDFDKVFVNYPPLIPDFLIDYLYKKRNGKLKYRFPGIFEQKIRALSHYPIFRRPISNNISALKNIAKGKKMDTYLISSRFSFLKKRTEVWLEKTDMSKHFSKLYFNFNNEQPHFFKDKIIKKEKITDFIDDDLALLLYLSDKNPKVNFYWLTKNANFELPKNVVAVNNLKEFSKKYL